ncbi:MAG: GNAT family N-acetyltransferase [Alphaproteobacteria bacterium]|nr:GNAT family N-acetyltransferase [Alphaproteobacteria bacterium]MCW5743738.1 GNAT family N-acetyltransferase [Alphaproteobacteria bacterium]
MTRNVQFRLLTPADARLYQDIRLEALQAAPEAFGSTYELERTYTEEQFADLLSRSDVFGAFRGSDLLGMAGYRTQAGPKREHKGFLWGMYVRDAARRTGVSKRLVEAVLGHARGRVELVQLSVVSDNETAQRLYRSCGFVVYGHEVHALKFNGRYYDEKLMAVALERPAN